MANQGLIKRMLNAINGKNTAIQTKNYAGARINRLTYDWPTQITSAGTLLRYNLQILRARSRELSINNDYARAFIGLAVRNIVGPHGIRVQNKAKQDNGLLDKIANDKIEENWQEFCRKGNCEVTGQMSMNDMDRVSLQSTARDGEVLVRAIEGYDNPWSFTTQLLEADHLDETMNVSRLPNGNSIRMGIEFDKWLRPVAYHLLTEHPGDYTWTWQSRKYERVPAEQIIHLFIRERINQPRGVPWMHSAMTRLNNIGAYEEAEIVGARIGASTMGIWEQDENANPAAVPGADGEEPDGEPIMEMEPGIFAKAPYGYKFSKFDPQHPSGNYGPFMKATLRGIASGLMVSYNSLAADLEGVNYSSIRAGLLEERDQWRLLQGWLVENYKAEIFRRWLRMALITQQVRLPLSKFERFHKPKFIARTWPWVDPIKDMEANVMALDNLLTTRTDLAEEQGEDFEEILTKRQEEEKLMQKYGVRPIEKVSKTPAEEKPKKKPSDTDEPADDDEEMPEQEAAGSKGRKIPGNGSGKDL